MRIIVADDSATARLVIRKCLEIAGCWGADFTDAADGAEALRQALRVRPDLLVTDLTMPVMDGEKLLAAVRADERLAGLPVLIITSAKNPAKEAELSARGAFAVLAKPVQPATLAAVLRPLLPDATGGKKGW